MKKNLIIHPVFCAVALVVTISSYGQQSANAFIPDPYSVGTAKLNNNLSYKAAALTAPSDINIKAMRDFMKSFKGAQSVQWYKVPDGTMAYFTNYGIKTRVSYDNKGNWMYNMRSYDEINLPREIRAQVKSVYYDYSITWVNEITKRQQTTYIVHMQDKKSWKTIKVCEGEEMETVETLGKM